MAATKNTNANAFAFDADKIKDMFTAAKMPVVDPEVIMAAQKKNIDALIEANKVVTAGYQDLYKRQTALFEAAVSQARDMMSGAKAQPLTVDQATASVDAMKTAFEKAAADLSELAEMAQKANTGAFEVVKARAEEAVAEFKAAAEMMVA
jgi:phasin family protein